MAMQISGVTIRGGVNLIPGGSSPAPTPSYSFQGSNYGYTSGGQPGTDVIDKFPFSSDSNATDVGNLTQARYGAAGHSSDVSGYTSGGYAFSLYDVTNVIDKFPFSSDANATDVGDLIEEIYYPTGQSSDTSGYRSGGYDDNNPVSAYRDTIDKFPFASDGNATDVGDLTLTKREAAGQSSTASGYTSGGRTPSNVDTIDKFPFASDSNATDVGNLTQARSACAGQQY